MNALLESRWLLIALSEKFLGDNTKILNEIKTRPPIDQDNVQSLANAAQARGINMITIADPNYPADTIKKQYSGLPPFVLYEVTPVFYDNETVSIVGQIEGKSYTAEFPATQLVGRKKSLATETAECVRTFKPDVILEAAISSCSVEDMERTYIKKLINSSDYFVNLKESLKIYSSRLVESILEYWTTTKDHGPSICSTLEQIEYELYFRGSWQGYKAKE